MVSTLEESENYADDESLMALAARTENASRAKILKEHQIFDAMGDGPKVVKIRPGRKNPSKVSKVKSVKVAILYSDAISLTDTSVGISLRVERDCYVTSTRTWIWIWVLFSVLANFTAGLVLY